MQANPTGIDLEQVLPDYLATTDRIAELVLAAAVERDSDRYEDAAHLVKIGRLAPQVLMRPGRLVISLIDTETGKSIGNIFAYSAPALGACGVPN